MSTVLSTIIPQPPRVHRSAFAADERRVRRLGAHIFAELLPRSTSDLVTVLPSRRPRLASGGPGWLQAGRVSTSFDIAAQNPHTPATRAGKETFLMKVYRTESSYYFSSRQLLPAGSVVFFSDKLRRYVHPTDGTLLDPHPRLQLLSEAESQEFEERWQGQLARF